VDRARRARGAAALAAAAAAALLLYRLESIGTSGPQAGRFREAHQFGIECFGFAGREADVEVIAVAVNLISRYGLGGVTVRLNSVGDDVCRPRYREALLAHFRPHAANSRRIRAGGSKRNPLRILDSKSPAEPRLVATAPTLQDVLCDDCREHFASVRHYLDSLGIAYEVDPRLVRGLDLLHAHGLRDHLDRARRAEHRVRRRPVRRARGVAWAARDAGRRLRPRLERFLMMVEAAFPRSARSDPGFRPLPSAPLPGNG